MDLLQLLDFDLKMCNNELEFSKPQDISDVQARGLDKTRFSVPSAALDLPEILGHL